RAPVAKPGRVLNRDELARLLPVLRQSPRPHAPAMLFMLLTLARREEVCDARWEHVDLAEKVWVIPETKNGIRHHVPLSRQAVALLTALRQEGARPADRVFSVGRRSPVAGGETRAPLGNWDRETKLIQQASGTSGWHRHDLRRTGATRLGELGVMPELIQAALNHIAIRSHLAVVYNRSRYRPQVAAALQQLADWYSGIETEVAARLGPEPV